MIIEDKIQSLTLSWFKKTSRSSFSSISIFEQIRSATRVLICMPEKKEEFGAAVAKLNAFQQIFEKAHFTIFYHRDIDKKFKPQERFEALTWNEKDFNRFGLPNPAVKKVTNLPYDIVLDLSICFSFLNVYIAHTSRAGLRICFSHPDRDELYNFLIRFETGQKPENALNILLKYLGYKAYI